MLGDKPCATSKCGTFRELSLQTAILAMGGFGIYEWKWILRDGEIERLEIVAETD